VPPPLTACPPGSPAPCHPPVVIIIYDRNSCSAATPPHAKNKKSLGRTGAARLSKTAKIVQENVEKVLNHMAFSAGNTGGKSARLILRKARQNGGAWLWTSLEGAQAMLDLRASYIKGRNGRRVLKYPIKQERRKETVSQPGTTQIPT